MIRTYSQKIKSLFCNENITWLAKFCKYSLTFWFLRKKHQCFKLKKLSDVLVTFPNMLHALHLWNVYQWNNFLWLVCQRGNIFNQSLSNFQLFGNVLKKKQKILIKSITWWKKFLFWVFLVHISSYSDWLRRFTD